MPQCSCPVQIYIVHFLPSIFVSCLCTVFTLTQAYSSMIALYSKPLSKPFLAVSNTEALLSFYYSLSPFPFFSYFVLKCELLSLHMVGKSWFVYLGSVYTLHSVLEAVSLWQRFTFLNH